jgi:hypothetical protein
VGVRGDRQAEPVCLVGQGTQQVGGELGFLLAGARGHRPAAGHHLDHVDAAVGALAYRGPKRIGCRRGSGQSFLASRSSPASS